MGVRALSLFIEPRVPAAWPEYTIEYRFGNSLYVITLRNENGVAGGAYELSVDGQAVDGTSVALVDDGQRHEVAVETRALAADERG